MKEDMDMDHYEHHARRPLLSFLSDNEIDAIHDTSLEILEGVGVDIHHEEARKLLYEAGAFVDGVNVRLPSNLIKYALGHAPKRVVQADRNDNRVMPLEVVRRIGPGGFFAGEEHTAANFKKETWYPDLFDKNIYDNWEKQGATTFAQRAAAKALHLLEAHRPEPLNEFVLKKIENAIHAL
jgi:trimethylamine--corrinoid protein Co-methyltransferase